MLVLEFNVHVIMLVLEFDVDVIMLVLTGCYTQSAELHECTVPAVQCIASGGY